MQLLLIGTGLGVLVSILPGPNAALCVSLASGGVRKALPVITGAALTDAVYSLLAAMGVLLAIRTQVEVLRFCVPVFLFAAAVLSWSPAFLSGWTSAAVPVLNPATATLWIGLSSIPALQVPSIPDALLRAVPVAIGTATWFLLVAAAAAKAGHRLGPPRVIWLRRVAGASLGVAGLVSLAALLG